MSNEEIKILTETEMIQKYMKTETNLKGQVNLKGINSEINEYILKNNLLPNFLNGKPDLGRNENITNNCQYMNNESGNLWFNLQTNMRIYKLKVILFNI